MRDLDDIMAAARSGPLAGELAGAFGLTTDKAQAVLAAALPQVAVALARAEVLPDVVKGALQGVHRQSFEAPATASSAPAVSAGTQVLRDIFHQSEVLKTLADTIAAHTGVPQDQVAAMLPAVASVLLGGVWHAMEQKGLAGALGQIGAALTQSGGARSSTAGGDGMEGALGGGILSHVLHDEGSAPVGGAQSAMAQALEALRGLLVLRTPAA